ncbi:MAG: DnaJ domain-containing protein [Deltaproteobacteria bacterium]|jgi:molecular chaperone DnaJ|nr:DnaJ domain-containing protein [Deltaproteobacteria bacterium]
MSLDPYKTLGVDKKASPEDIKKAYRNLARKYHPDVNPGDKAAEDKFKELSMAYDILSDPAKKSEYDNLGSEAFFERGFGGAGYQSSSFDFRNFRWDDIFDDIFGGGPKPQTGRRKSTVNFGGNGGFGGFGAGAAAPARGQDIVHRLALSFMDAVKGTQITLQLDVPVTCSRCGGQGLMSSGGGVGQCPQCGGHGSVITKQTIKTRIPAGVTDGQKIRLRGKGQPSHNGGPPGDLNLVVEITPDSVFSRDGFNLTMEKPVSVYCSLLGGTVEVPTSTGRATLKIPPLTQNGAKFRLKGQGVVTNKKTGDLIVSVKVVLPSSLSEEARQLVEKLSEVAPVNEEL